MALQLALLYILDSGCGERPVDFSSDYRASWLALGVLGKVVQERQKSSLTVNTYIGLDPTAINEMTVQNKITNAMVRNDANANVHTACHFK